jgi:hypothetical protein
MECKKRNVSKLSAYALFWDEDYWDCYIVLFSFCGVRVGCIEVAGGGCGVVASWLLLLLSLLGALSSNRDLGMTGLCVCDAGMCTSEGNPSHLNFELLAFCQ